MYSSSRCRGSQAYLLEVQSAGERELATRACQSGPDLLIQRLVVNQFVVQIPEQPWRLSQLVAARLVCCQFLDPGCSRLAQFAVPHEQVKVFPRLFDPIMRKVDEVVVLCPSYDSSNDG